MQTTYPACLHGEVEAAAREIYECRLAAGRPGTALEDWLEAEARVLESHVHSPARLVPGGDLFDLDAAGCWSVGQTGRRACHDLGSPPA